MRGEEAVDKILELTACLIGHETQSRTLVHTRLMSTGLPWYMVFHLIKSMERMFSRELSETELLAVIDEYDLQQIASVFAPKARTANENTTNP
ncbi:MAG: hypothetical protein WC712_14710 [Candidatus Brocadiia bacterium]